MNKPVFFYRPRVSIIDFVDDDGRSKCFNRTQAELEAEYGGPLEILPWDEAWRIYEDAHKKPPVEITSEDFWYYLEVLPPQAWVRFHGSESFHMVEFQTGDITTHLVRIGNRCFKLDDHYCLKHNQLVEMCRPLLALPQPTLESKMS